MTMSLIRSKSPISVSMPAIFSLDKRSILRVDQHALVLPKLGPYHFYQTGCHMLK